MTDQLQMKGEHKERADEDWRTNIASACIWQNDKLNHKI